ncbi:MAG: hypothetical protein ACYC6T_12865 [Thermoleophilia bacterium]
MVPFNALGILTPQDTTKPAVAGGCLQCHIGDGQLSSFLGAPANFDGLLAAGEVPQSAKEGIDCLLCHAGVNEEISILEAKGNVAVYKQRLEYDFTARKPVKLADDDPAKAKYPTGFKMEQDRSVETARTVGGEPDFANCFYPCHGYSGGGYENKKGARFEAQHDVHGAAGMDCVDCHKVDEGHRFAGGDTADIMVNDAWDVDIHCDNADCHGDGPHANRMIDQHLDKVDCTTCHITQLESGIKTRDWSGTPVLNATTGLYGPPTTKNTLETPTYLWWDKDASENGLSAPDHTAAPQKFQAEYRKNGKIYSFKNSLFTAPWDTENDQALFVKAGQHSVTGDVVLALTTGMNDAIARGLREGTTPWVWDDTKVATELEDVNYQVSHMVQAEAWGCDDCHTSGTNGVLDFEALGYSPDEIAELTTPR